MAQSEVIPKFSELNFEEIRKLVVQMMDDSEKTLLEKESNNETLDALIREHQGNSLAASADAPLVVDNILKRFGQGSLSGDIIKYIYIGSRDFYGRKENASSHNALMLRLTNDMAIDDKDAEGKKKKAIDDFNVWDPTPNKKVKDLWAPGYSYDCSIVGKPHKEGKIDENTGKTIVYYNIKDYRVIDNAFELLAKHLLTIRSGHEYFGGFKSGVDAELAKVLQPQMQYTPATIEYTVTDVSGIQVSQRILRGESYEWDTPKDAPFHPIVKANRQGQPQIVFNINGETFSYTEEEMKKPEAERKPNMTVVVYGAFNAADLAQYFVHSASLTKLFENPAFMAETPKNQADFIAMTLRGKKFRIVGPMQNIDFSQDGAKVFITVAGIGLVEVPPA